MTSAARAARAGRVSSLSRSSLAAVVVGCALVAASACTSSSPIAKPRATTSLGLPASVPPAPTSAGVDATPPGAVLTQRGNSARTGWYANEQTLTSATVSSGDFGRRVSYPVDGKVYAQPLYVPGQSVAGGKHNVVVVATENDTVYAFDADAVSPGAPLWHVSLLPKGARALPASVTKCTSIAPTVGITGTPVVDWSMRTLYAVSTEEEHGKPVERINAISLTDGHVVHPSVVVAAKVSGHGDGAHHGTVAFAAKEVQQRAGLLLDNGVVYAGFSAWCDIDPFHGWVIGYRAADLSRAAAWTPDPDGMHGGIWQSEGGIAAAPNGDLLVQTGDGTFDYASGGNDLGNSLVRLRPDGQGDLVPIDYFTPFDQACLARHDQDLGSGSPLLVPGHDELVTSSKEGHLYVLGTDHLGEYHTVPNPCAHREQLGIDQIRQELPLDTLTNGQWGTLGYLDVGGHEFVYGDGQTSHLLAFAMNSDGTLSTAPVAQGPDKLAYPGGIPVTSSNGTTPGSGVVWMADAGHGGEMVAYDGADVSHVLWRSTSNAARDALQGFDNFTVPIVAAGKVFVGDAGHLEIYGLLGATPTR